MMAIALGVLAAIGFSGASLLALIQNQLTARGRAYAVAVAAAILLVLALGDLFPESLEMAGDRAIPGFIAGFALLFLIETLTHAHTHHAPDNIVRLAIQQRPRGESRRYLRHAHYHCPLLQRLPLPG